MIIKFRQLAIGNVLRCRT